MTTTTLSRMLMGSVGMIALGVTAAPTACYGQNAGASKKSETSTVDLKTAMFADVIRDIKSEMQNGRTPRAAGLVTTDMNPYVILAAGPSLQTAFGSALQEWRTDVQTESPASSSGTTSVVSKGSVPSILGLAVENGALTQTTSGTSATFRTNPTGLIKALSKQDYIDSGPGTDQDAVVRFLRRASAAVTFNTTAGAQGSAGSQAGAFTGSARQISSFGFRYDIINHRDPRDPRYHRDWESLRNGALTLLAMTVHDFADQWQGVKPPDPNRAMKFNAWRDRAQRLIAASDANAGAAAGNSVETAVLAIADDFVKTFGDDPAIKAAANAAGRAFSDYLTASGNMRNRISKSPIVTFDYTDIRQGTPAATTTMVSANASSAMPGVKPPDLSNFKLIVAGGTVKGATLTGNASVTLFNSIPAGTKTGRLRDFQLSGQLDVPLREISNIGVPTFTASGLFLSLQQQPLGMPVLVNGVMESMKGNIGVGQAKITFPVKKGSGVKIPLSITYASRTELNKEHDVRGNIGLTFDLDSIFAGLKQ